MTSWSCRSRCAAAALVGVVLAVLRGYGLEGEDAIHAARIVRAALHGFVALEADEGFGLPTDLDESFRRLVGALDEALSQPISSSSSNAVNPSPSTPAFRPIPKR